MSLFVPSPLLLPAGDSKDARRFILASSEWVDLQNRVQSVRALPSDIGEYGERYGEPSPGIQMRDCFDAMHKLQQTAARYGSPKRLRTHLLNNPNFLAQAARPHNDAFSATVWTLERAHEDAAALAGAFRAIPALARGTPASGASARIRELFLGDGRIFRGMAQTVDRLDTLLTEFQGLEISLESAQGVMKTFTDRNSRTRTNLDQEIGGLRQTIARLEKARDGAYDKWLRLAMSACAVPAVIGIVGIAVMVVLAVPAGGVSFAVGAAGSAAALAAGAGALAAAGRLARSTYDELVAEVRAQGEAMASRACYRSDLGALDDLMKFSMPASSGVIVQLGAIRDGWAGALSDIAAGVDALNADNLRDGPWLNDAEMAGTAASWSRLDSALTAFAVGSFVDADLIDFGSELPHDDAGSQRDFAVRRAA